MVERADVVVIGAGGIGAAIAFYLVERGAEDVVVLDKHDLGSQTSPRAAGMLAHARSSDLMVELMKLASSKIERFSQDTGQPLDWTRSGSLKIARRAEDVAVLESEAARAQRFGLDAKPISAEEAHRLHPFLRPDGVVAAMHVAEDLYFDPPQVAIGFARGAEARGATVLPHTTVTGVAIEDGSVAAVATDKGTIRTSTVVDAAGAWTRQVAASSGIRVPLVPTRHQLFVTEPLDGARADLPLLRIIDAAVYVRPCDGGLLWGGFEEGPEQVDMDARGPRFRIDDLALDREVLRRLAADVEEQLPILGTAPVREHRGGLPTMTADGLHIVGPVPSARGFFVASGCNVAGLSASPAIGDLVAEWILDGKPSLDLSPLSIARFDTDEQPEDRLRRDAAWEYRHFYGSA